MAASLVAGPALTTLSNSISTILDVLVWVIALGYVYFGWKLIFGPGGGSKFGAGASDWIKEKAGDIADWNRARKKEYDVMDKAKKFSLLEYQDLEKLKKVVTSASNEDDLKKVKRAKNAAKRHESNAKARITDLQSGLSAFDLKSDPAFKKSVDVIVKKIGILNDRVILDIAEFDKELRTPAPTAAGGAFTTKRDTKLIPPLDRAILDEQAIQAEFEALKNLLVRKFGKAPRFRLW